MPGAARGYSGQHSNVKRPASGRTGAAVTQAAVRVLQCGHAFHTGCLPGSRLFRSPSCAVCQTKTAATGTAGVDLADGALTFVQTSMPLAAILRACHRENDLATLVGSNVQPTRGHVIPTSRIASSLRKPNERLREPAAARRTEGGKGGKSSARDDSRAGCGLSPSASAGAGAAALVELAKSAATVAREQRRALAAEQSQNARPAWVAEWEAEQVAAKSSTSEHDLRRLLRSRRPSQGTHAGSVRRQRGGGEGGGARGRGAC